MMKIVGLGGEMIKGTQSFRLSVPDNLSENPLSKSIISFVLLNALSHFVFGHIGVANLKTVIEGHLFSTLLKF